MTGKEVETVAVLVKRARERAERARYGFNGRIEAGDAEQSIRDLAEGLKSALAAIEMLTIETAALRDRLDHFQLDEANRRLRDEQARRDRRPR
jgi:hypothetical protein